MLKRFQILLSDWQAEYLKRCTEVNDMSFSEMTRILISEGILCATTAIHPEYKPGINKKALAVMIKKGANEETTQEEKHKLVAKLYFEARKAGDYRLNKIKTIKNKKIGTQRGRPKKKK